MSKCVKCDRFFSSGEAVYEPKVGQIAHVECPAPVAVSATESQERKPLPTTTETCDVCGEKFKHPELFWIAGGKKLCSPSHLVDILDPLSAEVIE